MQNHDFPEDILPPDPNLTPEEPDTGSVDFSDLGDLFAAPGSQDPAFGQVPQGTQDDLDLSEFDIPDETEDEQDALDFDKLNALLEEPAEPAEETDVPTYQAPDYPQEEPEDGSVLPGEAAWLLQKLRQLPPDPEDPYHSQAEDEAPEEEDYIPQEEAYVSGEESEPSQEQDYEPAPENYEETPSQEEPQQETQVAMEAPEPAESPAPAAPAQEEPPRKHVRKGRPKRKKGEGFFGIPNLVVTAVWIAITVLIGVTLGRMIWVCAADVLAFGREDKIGRAHV